MPGCVVVPAVGGPGSSPPAPALLAVVQVDTGGLLQDLDDLVAVFVAVHFGAKHEAAAPQALAISMAVLMRQRDAMEAARTAAAGAHRRLVDDACLASTSTAAESLARAASASSRVS
jgi:hypothetical protein